MSNSDASTVTKPDVAQVQLPKEVASLTESRKALVAENKLYRTQLDGETQGANLSLDQQARLRIARTELNSRLAANELEVEQLQKQLAQNTVQLTNARSKFKVELGILNKIETLAVVVRSHHPWRCPTGFCG